MERLRGRNAILTGASYGVGAHIARALAREGVNLGLAARSAGRLAEVAREIAGTGVRAVPIPTDLTDHAEREALVSRAEDEIGPVDLLVNNAGVHHGGRLHTRSAEQLRQVFETNLVAPVLLTRSVLTGMLERGRGHVVQVASLAGKVGLPYLASYAGSKHGLVGFTHAMQAELAGTGVHASVVCPGFLSEEGMWARLGLRVHPAFGLSRPERVARAVLRAIQRRKVEVLVNPLPVRPAIAAWALAPGLAARMFRVLGVDGSMRGAALRLEAEDGAAERRGVP